MESEARDFPRLGHGGGPECDAGGDDEINRPAGLRKGFPIGGEGLDHALNDDERPAQAIPDERMPREAVKILLASYRNPPEAAPRGVMAIMRTEEKDGFVATRGQAFRQPEEGIDIALAAEGDEEDAEWHEAGVNKTGQNEFFNCGGCGHGVSRRHALECTWRRFAMLLQRPGDGFLPRWILPHGTWRCGIAHGVCGDDGGVSGVFGGTGQRPDHAAAGDGVSRP